MVDPFWYVNVPSVVANRLMRFTLFAIVWRFLDANNVVIWATTHVSQENPHVKKETAFAFLNTMQPLLHQLKYIINMDQTLYDLRNALKNLAKRGEKWVTAKTVKV